MATKNLSELEPDDKDREKCIEFCLEAFRDKLSSIIDYRDLLFYENFDKDMRAKFRQQGKREDNKSVVSEMIDAILNMNDIHGRFTLLVEGEFSETENPKVMSILRGQKLPLKPEESKERLKQLNRIGFCKKISCDITPLITSLERYGVITSTERERIHKMNQHETGVDAAIDLLQIIANRVEDWFVKFIMSLIDLKLDDLAKEIDTDLFTQIVSKRKSKKETLGRKELLYSHEIEIANELGCNYTSLVSADSVSGRPSYQGREETFRKEYALDDNGQKCVMRSEETIPKTIDDNNFGTMEAEIKHEYHEPSLSKNNLSPYKPDDGADSLLSEVKSEKRSLELCDQPDHGLRLDSLLMDTENTQLHETSLTTDGTNSRRSNQEYHEPSLSKNNLSPYKPDDSSESLLTKADSVQRSLEYDTPDQSINFNSLLQDTENIRVNGTSLTDKKDSRISNQDRFTQSDTRESSSGESSTSSFDISLSQSDSSHVDNTSSGSSVSETYLNRRDASWRNDTGNETVGVQKVKLDFPNIQQITTTSAARMPVHDNVTQQQGTEYNIQTVELRQNSLDRHSKMMKDKDINVRSDGLNIVQPAVQQIEEHDVEVEDVDVSLRKYQEELARPALKGQNVIIVAPTGSGKTRVAMRIMQEHIRQQKGRGIAKVIFLVNQVALANQQGEACRELLKRYSCEVITGESQRKMKYLKDFINTRDILVVTAQVLMDAVVRKEITGISCFSLIVFDECHHTYANHTFNAIMGRYMDLKFEREDAVLPQIVGLTASVGVGKSRTLEKAVNHIKHLMANLDAQAICTVTDNITELREHVSLPEEETHKVPRRENDAFGDAVRKLMDTIENRMSRSSLVREIPEASKLEAVLKPPAQKGTAQYTQWVSKLWKETVKIRNPAARRFLTPCRQHLDLYNNALIIYNDARMEDAKDYLDFEMKVWKEDAVLDDNESILYGAYTKLRKYGFRVCPNPKLDKLKEMVVKAFQGEKWEDSRGIVFVKTRDLAKAILNWMKGEPGLRELKPIQFVGQNTKTDRGGGGMTKVEQDDALKYFRDGKHKLIIATSVAEEGLDISKCNLVIRYDHVTNEIAMVQSRGRGRAADSKYMVIAEEATGMAEKEELNMIREVMMRKAIIQLQQHIRDNPEKFKTELHKYQDEANLDRELKTLGKKRKVIRTGQFELRCLKCDHFICWSDDVKKIEDAHHVVIDQSLEERVKLSNSGQPKYQNETIQLVGKVICQGCGANLGVICIHRKVEFPVIKIENFLIVDTNGRQDTCKKWKSAPFHVSSLSTEDWREIVANFKEREGIE